MPAHPAAPTHPARPVGAHVAVAGGMVRAVERATEGGCDALQVFPSNPRAWALPHPDADADEAARELLEDRRWPLYVHVPYLVNPATPEREMWERSARSLDFALARGGRLGASGVIVHAGHARGAPRPEALGRAAAMLKVMLDRHPDVPLVVEATAGATGAVAGTVEEMGELLDAVDGDERLRFCLDTCHLWAAGVDYADDGGWERLRAELASLGTSRISVIHLNDSSDHCGARRDRHQNLGRGQIGVDAIRRLVTCAELATVPLVVETPGSADDRAADVALARSWTRPPEHAPD